MTFLCWQILVWIGYEEWRGILWNDIWILFGSIATIIYIEQDVGIILYSIIWPHNWLEPKVRNSPARLVSWLPHAFWNVPVEGGSSTLETIQSYQSMPSCLHLHQIQAQVLSSFSPHMIQPSGKHSGHPLPFNAKALRTANANAILTDSLKTPLQ